MFTIVLGVLLGIVVLAGLALIDYNNKTNYENAIESAKRYKAVSYTHLTLPTIYSV